MHIRVSSNNFMYTHYPFIIKKRLYMKKEKVYS